MGEYVCELSKAKEAADFIKTNHAAEANERLFACATGPNEQGDGIRAMAIKSQFFSTVLDLLDGSEPLKLDFSVKNEKRFEEHPETTVEYRLGKRETAPHAN